MPLFGCMAKYRTLNDKTLKKQNIDEKIHRKTFNQKKSLKNARQKIEIICNSVTKYKKQ